MSLTRARLKELLDYDPETGVFTWRERVGGPRNWNARFVGKRAGAISKKTARLAYRQIHITPRMYMEHRLAWLWVAGRFPSEIDHLDCDGLNNRWDNLRVCTRRENQGNRRSQRNKTGFKGVRRSGSKYIAVINSAGAPAYLGTFETAEAAHAAYFQKAVEVFGEFAREG